MSNENIIRAWKDEDYWHSLNEGQLAQVPENPAGIIELTQTEMEALREAKLYLCKLRLRSAKYELII